MIARIKKIDGARWSQQKMVWHLPDTEENRIWFKMAFGDLKSALSQIHEVNKTFLKRFIEQIQLKGYSDNTLTYRNEFGNYLNYLKETPAHNCKVQQIRDYILYCINEVKLSESTIQSRMYAFNFFYKQVLKRELIEIPRPKKHVKLPKVIAPNDIKKLFDVLLT